MPNAVELRDPSNPNLHLTEDVRDALVGAGFGPAINHYDQIEAAIGRGDISSIESAQVYASLLVMFSAENADLRQVVYRFYPEFRTAANAIDFYIQSQNDQSQHDNDNTAADDYMAALSSDPDHPLESAIEYFDSHDRLREQYEKQFVRPDEEPAAIHPWECRIGAARFFVPPISIHVNQAFKVSSLGGAGIRQASSAKFNSGHTETTITMTLYFPNQDTIWGLGSADALKIDFDKDDASIVDRFISSLRGMITQFKYAPFLPIRNDYLNKAFNITGVTLDSMSISTVEEFPFCLAVTLTMSKFNHKVFLPVIEDFNNAIHWGKFRQYIGRAAERMATNLYAGYYYDDKAQSITPTDVAQDINDYLSLGGREDRNHLTPGGLVGDIADQLDQSIANATRGFDRAREIQDARALTIYYPKSTPARVLAPDLSDFRSQGEDEGPTRNKNIWEEFLGFLGFDVNTLTTPTYEYLDNYSSSIFESFKPRAALMDFLNTQNILAEAMTSGELDKYKANLYEIYAKHNGGQISDETKLSISAQADTEWMYYIAMSWKDTPFFKKRAEAQRRKDEETKIHEWEVPMEKIVFDPTKFIVKGVSCGLSNRFCKLQVQMQDEPTYQHIGGGDTTLNIDMFVLGSDNLAQFRRLFDHIHGLARLEHAHGVLGFLGIKTVIAGLAGVKYVIPLNFQTSTVPGYPNVYQVQLSFVDFDILQQKREDLTSDQQIELIEAFGKRNPFFRLRQLWGATNTYPDLPLAMRDEGGKIVGHLDPDFYFKAYQTFDDDLFSWTNTASGAVLTAANDISEAVTQAASDAASSPNPFEGLDPFKIDTFFPFAGEGENSITAIRQTKDGMSIGEISANDTHPNSGTWADEGLVPLDDVPSRNLGPDGTVTDGTVAYGQYQHEYDDQTSHATKQYELMMRDTQFRNKSGRMVRAFPTYMLWLIDEGGNFAGVKLYDNFYGLTSVIDFSIHQSEDVLGDTLVLRLSNLYQKLTTPPEMYRAGRQDDPIQNQDGTGLIDVIYNRNRNLVSGTSDSAELNKELLKLSTVRLKPGVRVHLRAGYSANPNALPTLFNGTITAVEQGDIVTVIAQSDAIELGAYVNTTEPNGSSGKIDGGFLTNLWLSEPRDLMVRLLTMGSSNFREGFARASRGKIFSQSKFGIRHFGTMLYPPLTEEEASRANKVLDTASKATNDPGDKIKETDPSTPVPAGFDSLSGESGLRLDITELVSDMWNQFFVSRDYEIFKRNIYPGNGLGVAQFLGGDLFEIGEMAALSPLQAGSDADPISTTGGTTQADDGVIGPNNEVLDEAITDSANDPSSEAMTIDVGNGSTLTTTDIVHPANRSVYKASVGNALERNKFLQLFGMAGAVVDDDTNGLDEVSFRAQTYMKTVWDLFKICAALIPNYIVAVRPFEDRSTVFYGKPHWLYTSGLIPITTGVSKETELDYAEGNDLLEELQIKIAENANPIRDLENEMAFLNTLGSGSVMAPGQFGEGEVYSGQAIDTLPRDRVAQSSGQLISNVIPYRSGKVNMEMHTPAIGEDPAAGTGHMQLDSLPEEYRWPGYMDAAEWRDASGNLHGQYHGGYDGFDEIELPEQRRDPHPGFVPGAFTGRFQLSAQAEQYYMAMRWPSSSTPGFSYPADIFGAKIICRNKRTNKAVVCTPGDYGPAEWVTRNQGVVAGISPDAMHVTGGKAGDEYEFGFVPDATPLGPVANINPGGSSSATDDPATSTNEAETSTEQPHSEHTNAEVSWYFPLPGAHDARTFEAMYGAFYSAVPVYVREEVGLYGGDDIHLNTGLRAAAMYNSRIAVRVAQELNTADGVNYTPTLLNGRDVLVSEAETIWDDFRNTFPVNQDAFGYFMKLRGIGGEGEDLQGLYASLYNAYRSALGWNTGRRSMVLELDNEIDRYAVSGDNHIRNTGTTMTLLSTYKEAIEDYNKLLVDFMRMLWNNPRSRAWVVVTADRIEDRTSFNLDSVGFGPIRTPGLSWDPDADSSNHQWSFHDVMGLWKQTLDEYNSNNEMPTFLGDLPQSVLDYINGHMSAGETSDDWASRRMNDVANVFESSLGELFKYVASATLGVISIIRNSLMSLGQGLNMAGNMQLQANIMNRIFNDSIYYQAGTSEQDLLRLADNPFTREYAEPVIEIREPFQRMHYFDSFQHILDNRIQENLDNVATVITATSNGKYPVTVHFDKGLSPERQIEKTVETGLYWDNAKGSGFFSQLHPLLHPIETMRGIHKGMTGSSDELLSRRIALSALKENLKDIYKGELWVIGNPDVRPHDLVYLADVYSRCYGIFEVEQIVTHFTPELGFVSAITPNAVVTINDPTRWSMLSWVWSRFSTQNLRHTTRYMVSGRTAQSSIINNSSTITVDELIDSLSTSLAGYTQYTHGASGLIKDLAGISKAGMLAYNEQLLKDERDAAGSNSTSTLTGAAIGAFNPMLNMFTDKLLWPAWKAVRDNLYDQHGCYIQYLTKDGQALDAGLSYARGVAVGRPHSKSLLPYSLGLNVNTIEEGHARITTDDILVKLGWKEIDVATARQELSWWVSRTNSDVLKLAGKSPDGISLQKPEVHLVIPTKVVDGDTIHIEAHPDDGWMPSGSPKIRFAGVDAAELLHKDKETQIDDPLTEVNESLIGAYDDPMTFVDERTFDEVELNSPNNRARLLQEYLEDRLINEPKAEGRVPVIAVRINRSNQYDVYNRLLGVIFANVPRNTPKGEEGKILQQLASKEPLISWDAYMDDGRPYTMNWEVIATGLASTDMAGLAFNSTLNNNVQ